jgi:hypothetical protein
LPYGKLEGVKWEKIAFSLSSPGAALRLIGSGAGNFRVGKYYFSGRDTAWPDVFDCANANKNAGKAGVLGTLWQEDWSAG